MVGTSQKKKINIVKSDFLRVVLTDVHPYELPFIITNEGFYTSSKKSIIKNNKILNRIFLERACLDTKPYIYEIAKDREDTRKLFLPHPASQIKISKIYKEYHQLITYLCSRSKFSLRKPYSIATYYRESDNRQVDDEGLKGEGVNINEPKYASSFFEYKKISFLYKFYDSYEFHRIERKFNKLIKFDIAKCFGSISTFMVPISLRGHENYKRDIKCFNFENEFSNAMSDLYDGNTHGIVVGPEFSRIFAEILLQSIDAEIEVACNNLELEHGVHYEMRRYVDDYFLFYNSDHVRIKVFDIVKNTLEKYKLFVNESKNQMSDTPFITGVSIAKKDIGDEISKFFRLFSEDESTGKYEIGNDLRRYYQISNRMITDIKAIVADKNVSYSSITGYFFTMMRINVSKIRSAIKSDKFNMEHNERLLRFFLVLIDYMFFVYQNDFRVRSTYIISQIIIIISDISKIFDKEQKSQISKKIKDEIASSISFANRRSFLRHVESLNLLIALKVIGELNSITIDNLKRFLGLNNLDFESVDYFNTMVFLYLVENNSHYSDFKQNLINVVKLKFHENSFAIESNSEACHIFFDLMSCPHVNLTDKIELVQIVNRVSDLGLDDNSSIEKFVLDTTSQSWFIDWESESIGHIEKLLHKKELKSPYS